MEIEKSISERAQIWLNGSFDDATKAAVKQLMETNPVELTIRSTGISNSGPEDCGV